MSRPRRTGDPVDRLLTVAVALASVTSACGGDQKAGLRVFAEAAVQGDVVVIKAGVELIAGRKTTFTVNGVDQTVDENWAHFGFALSDLPAGSATFTVAAKRDDGKAGKQKVTVAIPAQPRTEPFFHVAGCGDSAAIETVKLEGDWLSPSMGRCGLGKDDGALRLITFGSRGARVSLGGAVLELPDAPAAGLPFGATVRFVDLLSGIDPTRYSMPDGLEVPITLERAGATTTSTLKLTGTDLARLVGDGLGKVGQTKGLRWARPHAAGEAAMAVVVTSNVSHLRVLGQPGPLRDVDVVVVATDQERRELGECGPYADRLGVDKGMIKHVAIDQEVVLYAAHDGTELARKRLSARTDTCPDKVTSDFMLAISGVDTADVDALAQVELDRLAGR